MLSLRRGWPLEAGCLAASRAARELCRPDDRWCAGARSQLNNTVDPNAAKYRGLVEVPFAAMMAVDATEGLVRAPLVHAPPAEAAEDAEEAAADPKGKKEAPKKGAKGPEELPVEEEEEVPPSARRANPGPWPWP